MYQPVSYFRYDFRCRCNGAVAEFTNTSNSEFDFVWNFSDGDSSTQVEVEKVFDFSSFNYTTIQDSRAVAIVLYLWRC